MTGFVDAEGYFCIELYKDSKAKFKYTPLFRRNELLPLLHLRWKANEIQHIRNNMNDKRTVF